jgi:DNA-binding transcriptional LysR family regulator
MNLRNLAAFRAVMELGTVTEAAARLHITQPAMSRLISSLENNLDIKLFHRRRKRLVPTSEGEEFYRIAQRILASVDELPRLVQDIRAHAGTRLRIASMPRVAEVFVVPALQRFSRLYPRVNHTVEIHSRIDMEQWISRQHFDIGLGALPTVHAALRTEELCRVPAVAVMSSTHRLADRLSITVDELIDEPLVVPIAGTVNRQNMDTILENAGVTPKIRTECGSGVLACQLAAAGVGITICDALTPRGIIQSEMALVPIEPRFDMAFGILYPIAITPETVTTEFTGILREVVAEIIDEHGFLT